METVLEWLPRIGAVFTLMIGLAGYFKPTLITDGCNIELGSSVAASEARGVFGGLNIGWALSALVLDHPAVYLALGFAWVGATSARFYSMVVDGSTVKESIPPIVIDGTIALLCLSSAL